MQTIYAFYHLLNTNSSFVSSFIYRVLFRMECAWNETSTFQYCVLATANLNLITHNVNGLRLTPKRRTLFHDLRQHNADIIFLQEVHGTIADKKIWVPEWGPTYFSYGRSNSRGVCILFARNFSLQIEVVKRDEEGRYLILQICRDEEVITLLICTNTK